MRAEWGRSAVVCGVDHCAQSQKFKSVYDTTMQRYSAQSIAVMFSILSTMVAPSLERIEHSAILNCGQFKLWRSVVLREGGASALAAMGVDEQHIAQLGWAAGSSVWQRYTDDPAVMRQRAIQRSHMMVEDMEQPKKVQ